MKKNPAGFGCRITFKWYTSLLLETVQLLAERGVFIAAHVGKCRFKRHGFLQIVPSFCYCLRMRNEHLL